MIRGRFNEHGQAVLDGLLSFRARAGVGDKRLSIAVEFVIDTGSDATLVLPDHYAPYSYSDFRASEEFDAGGYGGGFLVRQVPISRLQFRLARGGFGSVGLTHVQVARPHPNLEGLPSVIGRDLIDRYRLVVDKSANLVLLERPTGPTP